jgi:photosystem II stability/assembly factor-like uncharacterized protein
MRSIFIGLFLFCSIGQAAQQWRLAGFANDTVRCVAVHPRNPDLVFASTTGGIFRSENKGDSWTKVRDGFHYLVFDPSDSLTIYGLFSTGSRSDGIWLSHDLGDSWELLAWHSYPTALISLLPHGMMLGTKGGGVYWSQDSGKTWSEINSGLTDKNIFSLVFFDLTDPTPVFLAGTGNGIYSLKPPAEAWVACASPSLPAKSIAAFWGGDPLYAAIGAGSYSDGIYKSPDFGANWNVAQWILYPSCIIINQRNSNTVYAADSGEGVIITRDGGTTWDSLNEGLQNHAVLSLVQSSTDTDRLYAGTEAGLWVYDFAAGLSETQNPACHLKVVAATLVRDVVKVRYYLRAGVSDRVEIAVYDITGCRVARIIKTPVAGWHEATLGLKRTGVYLIRLKVGEETDTIKAVVVR